MHSGEREREKEKKSYMTIQRSSPPERNGPPSNRRANGSLFSPSLTLRMSGRTVHGTKYPCSKMSWSIEDISLPPLPCAFSPPAPPLLHSRVRLHPSSSQYLSFSSLPEVRGEEPNLNEKNMPHREDAKQQPSDHLCLCLSLNGRIDGRTDGTLGGLEIYSRL